MIKLFTVSNGKVIPTEHCYNLNFLKRIMEEYPEEEIYMKIFGYLFYMSCPNPEENPFFFVTEEEKEEMIIEELDIDFSLDDEIIIYALEKCKKLYETPTMRAYLGIKKALDSIADYMNNTKISDGRDGNLVQIIRAAKEFDAIRQSYKGIYKDLMEEQKTSVRGGLNTAYDQL